MKGSLNLSEDVCTIVVQSCKYKKPFPTVVFSTASSPDPLFNLKRCIIQISKLVWIFSTFSSTCQKVRPRTQYRDSGSETPKVGPGPGLHIIHVGPKTLKVGKRIWHPKIFRWDQGPANPLFILLKTVATFLPCIYSRPWFRT